MKTSPHPSNLLAILVTAFAPTIWGTTYLVTTELLPTDRPLYAALIRTVPAGALLIALTRSFVPQLPWRRLLTLSILNIGAFQALLFVAAYRLPGGVAAIVGALQPLTVLTLSWSMDGEKPRSVTVLMALFGILGMTLLFASPEVNWDPTGLAAAFGGTACMALGTFLSRRWRSKESVLGFTGWQLFLGGLFLSPLALLLEPPLPTLSASNWIGYAYLGVPGTLVAYSLWFRGIAHLSPVAVSALGLLSPVTAIALGWLVLGEALGSRGVIGVVVVLASIASLQRSAGATPKPQTGPSGWEIPRGATRSG